jgi:hypothetical protein
MLNVFGAKTTKCFKSDFPDGPITHSFRMKIFWLTFRCISYTKASGYVQVKLYVAILFQDQTDES